MRGKNISVGDYPERDILDDDSEDEETEDSSKKVGVTSDAAGVTVADEEEDEI